MGGILSSSSGSSVQMQQGDSHLCFSILPSCLQFGRTWWNLETSGSQQSPTWRWISASYLPLVRHLLLFPLCFYKYYGKGWLGNHCLSQRQNTNDHIFCYILPLRNAMAPRLWLPDALSSEPGVHTSCTGTIFFLWEAADMSYKCLYPEKYFLHSIPANFS